MTAFSDYHQAFPESVRISGPISDYQDKRSWSYVPSHLAHPEYIEFAPVDGLTSSDNSQATTTQAINLLPVSSAHAANNSLFYLYESTMPTVINYEQAATAAIYGRSVGVDHCDRAVYLATKSTGREEIKDCDSTHLFHSTAGDGSGMEVPLAENNTACCKMNKRKTDPYVNGGVLETNVRAFIKKSKKNSCKSSANSSAPKDHEDNSNRELGVIRHEPPELFRNIVQAQSQKDYIHVRARRGQATDSHSLAERVRRQKISDRMNALQKLVPGCNKVTSKALLLEEIINYVQSLQSQVEILSMKLASITPVCAFEQQRTGHVSQELLGIPDPMVAYGTAPSYVDHPAQQKR